MRQLDPLTKRRRFERLRMLDCAPVRGPQPVRRATSRPPRPVFAHRVEAALAEVFDEHRIAWLYEPHTFPLERADDGTLTRAFTPDFFAPEIGIYVECTVARRALTTRKRQKARAAERLYGIVVEIAYRADLEALARQWSLHELSGALCEEPVP